jgi:putative membrane protein
MSIDLTLSDADKARITAAVTAAELKSAGEIVTIIAPRSDTYADIAQDWAIFIAFLAFAIYVAFEPFYQHFLGWVMGGWDMPSPHLQLLILFFAVLLKYLGTRIILQWKSLRLLITPRWIKRHRVRAQALTVFKVTTQQRTTGGTGVLIYLSEEERMAEIVAEAGIYAKVADSIWGEAMAALLADVREGRVADGMIAAVAIVGDVLTTHFPRDANDVNELPDRVIEL